MSCFIVSTNENETLLVIEQYRTTLESYHDCLARLHYRYLVLLPLLLLRGLQALHAIARLPLHDRLARLHF